MGTPLPGETCANRWRWRTGEAAEPRQALPFIAPARHRMRPSRLRITTSSARKEAGITGNARNDERGAIAGAPCYPFGVTQSMPVNRETLACLAPRPCAGICGCYLSPYWRIHRGWSTLRPYHIAAHPWTKLRLSPPFGWMLQSIIHLYRAGIFSKSLLGRAFFQKTGIRFSGKRSMPPAGDPLRAPVRANAPAWTGCAPRVALWRPDATPPRRSR